MPAFSRIARWAGLAVAAAAAWLLLPAGLGGGTTYLATHGVSMEPMFHAGDLAVVRAAGSYAVGDVVAYHSTTLDTTVLHRIVASDSGSFTTQGDNNGWQDPDHPTAAQVVGRLWVAVPHGGQALAFLRTPLGLLALGSVVIVVTALLGNRRRRRAPSPARRVPSPARRAAARRVAPVAAAAAVVAAAGGVAAFLVPATGPVAGSAHLTVRGQYSYAGTATPGVTYPEGRIATGDPVWRTLAGGITVSLQQTVDGPDLTGASGSLRLDLSVSTSDGWSAPLTTGPTATVDGPGVTATVPVDLRAAAALVQRHYTEIGATGDSAVLTVTPVGDVAGDTLGQEVALPAPTPVTFALDSAALRPPDGDQLTSSTTVPVATTEVAPRTLPLLRFELPVSLLRGIACLVAAFALATATAAWSIGWTDTPRHAGEVVLRDRRRVLAVAALPAMSTVVELPDAAALNRVADRVDGFVLQHEGLDATTYLIQDGATTYRFRPAAVAAPRAADVVRPMSHRRPARSLRDLVARAALG
jgi:signal peptidase I